MYVSYRCGAVNKQDKFNESTNYMHSVSIPGPTFICRLSPHRARKYLVTCCCDVVATALFSTLIASRLEELLSAWQLEHQAIVEDQAEAELEVSHI